MNTTNATILLLLSLTVACANTDAPDGSPPDAIDAVGVLDGRADGFVVSPGSAEADAVLALVNRPIGDLPEAEALRQLIGTRVHGIPTDGILAYRLGPDELPGGPLPDDQEFADLRALDAIAYVGPVAIRRLWELAKAEGLYAPSTSVVCPQVGRYEQSNRLYGTGRVITNHRDLIAIQQSGCTKIEGTIELDLELGAGHRQLEAFENIEEIGRLVVDRHIGLENMTGLSNLRRIGSLIYHSTELTDLKGLEGVTEISGDLRVRGVNSLDGLDNLERVEGRVELAGITDISALSVLEFVGAMYLASIESLDGLDGLEEVGDSLTIRAFPEAGPPALRSLRTVGAALMIEHTLSSAVRGFDSLEVVGSQLRLHVNRLDTSGAFGALRAVGSLDIKHSYGPVAADLTGLSTLQQVGGDLRVEISSPGSTLAGLESVEVIEGHLHVAKVRGLANFDDLVALSGIGRDLYVHYELPLDVVDAFVLSLDHFAGNVYH